MCPYNTCTRRFAQKHNLEIHIRYRKNGLLDWIKSNSLIILLYNWLFRTHTGEKPLQCEICSKQFAALGNFQAHKKIHSGIRDQICPVCNKGFLTSGDLSRHMATHTGIKNHHCDICGKSFTRNRDMVRVKVIRIVFDLNCTELSKFISNFHFHWCHSHSLSLPLFLLCSIHNSRLRTRKNCI